VKRQIRILTNAGILSPVELRKLTAIARSYACDAFQFTDRNEIVVDVSEWDVRTLMAVFDRNGFTCFEGVQSQHPIVTSYQANGILKTTSWLTDDVYLDVVSSFQAHASVRVNIVDPLQALVPLYTGQLNFIASHHKNFWYLHINLPDFEEGEFWPAFIYTDDILTVTRDIERLLSERKITNVHDLFENIDSTAIRNSRAVDKELVVEQRFIPTYEGWHTGHSSCWLGIYTKNYKYSLDFVDDLCDVCVDRDVAKIHITSWRSLIIKGIREQDRIPWETLLGKHTINTRHAYAELYWQLEEITEESLALRNKIVREFYLHDANTFGLYFALRSNDRPAYGNIIIQPVATDRYTLYYTANFSPNENDWVLYQKNCDLDQLIKSICELNIQYHSFKGSAIPSPRHRPATGVLHTTELYQCKTCLTVYNEKVGDVVNQISAGTPFKDLPATYCCPVCDGGVEDYALMEEVHEM